MTNLGVLVLAAGLSSRLGGPNKLLMPWRGRALVSHVLALAEALPAAQKVLVTHRDERHICDLLADAADWTCAFNDAAASGLASSLRLGLAHLDGCASVLVLLGDMPDIAPSTVDALIAAAAVPHDFYAIVPVYRGDWGNPVILGPAAMAACADLTGDQGARLLLRANQDRVMCVAVDDPAILRDFDVLADFVAI
jgi:molybdenum cofactor cytidylyltransferase